jgi:hypothetical protein
LLQLEIVESTLSLRIKTHLRGPAAMLLAAITVQGWNDGAVVQ